VQVVPLPLTKRLKDRNSPAKMLVWSMYSESLYAERALQAGAAGYITKEEATDAIVRAIRHVLAGGIYLSPRMTEAVVRRAVAGPGKDLLPEPVAGLSDRELEVFRHLGRGLDTHQIAGRMRVSPKTVETYRARIKEKLGLDSATAVLQRAVLWVVENG
jgi:DNA-binding NarL/FixJ family response regulator